MIEIIKDRLCSFDEQVRVELGPQIIELDCTDENLTDDVTHLNYKRGKIDAYGQVIDPDTREKMNCVDWDAKHKPHIWKIYQMKEVNEGDHRFIQVDESTDKQSAISIAKSIYEGMQ